MLCGILQAFCSPRLLCLKSHVEENGHMFLFYFKGVCPNNFFDKFVGGTPSFGDAFFLFICATSRKAITPPFLKETVLKCKLPVDKQKQWLLNQNKISVHFWQNGVNRADKNNKKGLALERQFRSKDGGQATIPVQSPLVEPN